MIIHTIAPYVEKRMTRQQKAGRFAGEFGSDKHKEYIFERSLNNCKFELDEVVQYKGQRYIICNIETEFRRVGWDGLSPEYIDIWDGGNVMWSVNPGKLKRRK